MCSRLKARGRRLKSNVTCDTTIQPGTSRGWTCLVSPDPTGEEKTLTQREQNIVLTVLLTPLFTFRQWIESLQPSLATTELKHHLAHSCCLGSQVEKNMQIISGVYIHLISSDLHFVCRTVVVFFRSDSLSFYLKNMQSWSIDFHLVLFFFYEALHIVDVFWWPCLTFRYLDHKENKHKPKIRNLAPIWRCWGGRTARDAVSIL